MNGFQPQMSKIIYTPYISLCLPDGIMGMGLCAVCYVNPFHSSMIKIFDALVLGNPLWVMIKINTYIWMLFIFGTIGNVNNTNTIYIIAGGILHLKPISKTTPQQP